DLAERVLEIYWHQTRPFEAGVLKQTTGTTARIPLAAAELRSATGVSSKRASLDLARLRAPDAYEAAVLDVTMTLARQPLYRLQRTTPDSGTAFLYDDSWL